MSPQDDSCVEIEIPGHGRKWVRASTLRDGDGPIMPEPNHDETLGISYAHLCNGVVLRYRDIIARREDIVVVGDAR